MRDNELTKLLGWPGYRVYQHEINEKAKTLKLWVRRKRGNRKLVCSGCGRKLEKAHEVSEREVRDLPCMEFRTTVVVEVYRVGEPEQLGAAGFAHLGGPKKRWHWGTLNARGFQRRASFSITSAAASSAPGG